MSKFENYWQNQGGGEAKYVAERAWIGALKWILKDLKILYVGKMPVEEVIRHELEAIKNE